MILITSNGLQLVLLCTTMTLPLKITSIVLSLGLHGSETTGDMFGIMGLGTRLGEWGVARELVTSY